MHCVLCVSVCVQPPQLSKKEIEELLKKGAYGALMEGDDDDANRYTQLHMSMHVQCIIYMYVGWTSGSLLGVCLFSQILCCLFVFPGSLLLFVCFPVVFLLLFVCLPRFCEEDIDQILEQRAHVVQLENEGKGSTFSKASFVSDESSDINIDDPDFWQKWAEKAKLDLDELVNKVYVHERTHRYI